VSWTTHADLAQAAAAEDAWREACQHLGIVNARHEHDAMHRSALSRPR